MNPAKVSRDHAKFLTDLPNIGKAMADDLRLIGIHEPAELAGRCPLEMYRDLCRVTEKLHDPCVIDVFMSITCFMSGGDPLPWWSFTEERKRLFGIKKSTE
ncbi:helix-hairpin-helix domain-containing protein [Chlorobium phaeobacteroides]|jgi:hypothetical protein|uniref:Putative mitomycin resistance protein n=1 Tax=Chlorobium phaeobacteroides (strain DSM 266 / SMG 266 / 2430) TaxID=290317 RepID=A1BF93_CHLPD|nr:helix-hairpin-helix domain-containing protein [Chlorobium phaeobacteroides]ABL65070.1 putative mitomycin resistance protein [Chlorobium phaeobacteroides DSM 266]MBV5326979.1 helix-hairpin-helix domain-containing protein [Chlorobium sp.]